MKSKPPADLSRVEAGVISWLKVMPLLDRAGLEVLTGCSRSSTFRAVKALESAGRILSFRASVPGTTAVRRMFLTAAGIDSASSLKRAPVDTFLADYPVSDHWIRLLISRLSCVTSVYRFAVALAEVAPIRGFRWYRKLPLDAVVELDQGRVLAVLREGRMASSSHLGRRLRSLLRFAHPGTVILLAPDELRVQDWKKLVQRLPFNAVIALENDVLRQDPGAAIWHLPSDHRRWRLQDVIGMVRGGQIPIEPRTRRRPLPPTRTEVALRSLEYRNPSIDDRLLPALLDAGGRRVLDFLADWPWISFGDLQRSLCVSRTRSLELLDPLKNFGLISTVRLHGRVRHLVSDRGLRYLARQDRILLPAVLRRWSASPIDPGAPFSWRNVSGSRSRQLVREIAHTAAIHGFTAALASQAAEKGGELIDAYPAHRAVRRFTLSGRLVSINPDALYRWRLGESDRYFFLEWESGTGSVAHFVNKLDPYAAYQSSRQALGYLGHAPAVLFVFRDEIVEAEFSRVATELVNSAAAPVPILTSTEPLARNLGPWSAAWRTPPAGVRVTLQEYARAVAA